MKTLYFSIIFLFYFSDLHSQEGTSLSNILNQVSTQWKQDSSSCNGYRNSVSKSVLEAKVDSVDKKHLLSKLGKPNKVQKFSSGNTNKNYISYIYLVYKDACPNIVLEGLAIGFIFDESEQNLLEIKMIVYCG